MNVGDFVIFTKSFTDAPQVYYRQTIGRLVGPDPDHHDHPDGKCWMVEEYPGSDSGPLWRFPEGWIRLATKKEIPS